jgi:hypothetical protein
MTYEAFLAWCIDTSRDDRATFVAELPIKLNSVLNESRPARRRPVSGVKTPGGPQKGALKLALKSVKNHLTGGPSRA